MTGQAGASVWSATLQEADQRQARIDYVSLGVLAASVLAAGIYALVNPTASPWKTAVSLAVHVAVQWLLLLIVVPLAQRVAEFGLPPLVEMLWKLALVVFVTQVISLLLAPVNWYLAGLASGAVFWLGMFRVCDLDFFGAAVIYLVSWLLQWYAVMAIMSWIAGTVHSGTPVTAD